MKKSSQNIMFGRNVVAVKLARKQFSPIRFLGSTKLKTFSFLWNTMVNVLKFRTLYACQKGLDKQGRPRSDCFWRSSLIRIRLGPCLQPWRVFCEFQPWKPKFYWEQNEKSVQNFIKFTVKLRFQINLLVLDDALVIWSHCSQA